MNSNCNHQSLHRLHYQHFSHFNKSLVITTTIILLYLSSFFVRSASQHSSTSISSIAPTTSTFLSTFAYYTTTQSSRTKKKSNDSYSIYNNNNSNNSNNNNNIFMTKKTLTSRRGNNRAISSHIESNDIIKNNDNNDDDDIINNDILWKFATHTNESYHYFQPKEAEAIRICLLEWYRANRRKLPWRGDAGPFDGSTAGINNNSNKNNSNKSSKRKAKDLKSDKSQKSIKSFFNNTTRVKMEENRNNIDEIDNEVEIANCDDKKKNIIPITGYSVWVSEIMLQQTRVEAVIPYYLKWMESFPTVHHLANATDDEVNAHWAGLGFYRRARLLHKGAKYVSNELDGNMPQTVNELMKIDGVGRYTASAIASIAFDTCVPVVDGNVCRVLARLRGVANHIKAPIFKDGIGWTLAEQIVTAGDGLHAGEVNQAMMELGATYCAPSGTGIDENDPLTQFYLSTRIGTKVDEMIQSESNLNSIVGSSSLINDYISNASAVRGANTCALCNAEGISSVLYQIAEDLDDNVKANASIIGHSNFPIAPPKKCKKEEVLVIAAMSVDLGKMKGGEHWLMVKRPKGGLLAGQWEFPSKCIWSSAHSGAQKQGPVEVPNISIDVRRDAIVKLLQQYDFEENQVQSEFTASDLWSRDVQRLSINEETPIEHIFSHIRHSMWIEYAEIKSKSIDSSFTEKTFLLSDGREYKWMNADNMNDVGITSAINKILASIQKIRQSSNIVKQKKVR